jgi:hypothetical protein
LAESKQLAHYEAVQRKETNLKKPRGVNINPDFQGKQDLKVPTLFDMVQPSIAVDVVGYNMDTEARTHIATSRTLDEFVGRTLDHFLEEWRRVQHLISHPWKVFMFYIALTDHAGHAWGISKLRAIYHRMNQLSYDLKEGFPKIQDSLLCQIMA